MSTTNSQHERNRYEVTLLVHTEPRSVVFTKYAESPEHAIEKAKKDLGEGYVVEQAMARKLL